MLIFAVLGATVLPFIWGNGILQLVYGKNKKVNISLTDSLITGWMAGILAAFFGNVAGIYFGGDFRIGIKFFLIALYILSGISLISYIFFFIRKNKTKDFHIIDASNYGKIEIVTILIAIIMLTQIIMVVFDPDIYIGGDQTLETVNAMINTGKIYSVNPLTGAPYTLGVPNRFKILCLPFLYATVAEYVKCSPEFVIYSFFPLLGIVGYYLSYIEIGKILFSGKEHKNQIRNQKIFVLSAVMLLFVTDVAPGLIGFDIFHAGYRAESLRAGVFIPFLFASLLKGNVIGVLFTLATEIAICWTFYGIGQCAIITFFMVLVMILYKKLNRIGRVK